MVGDGSLRYPEDCIITVELSGIEKPYEIIGLGIRRYRIPERFYKWTVWGKVLVFGFWHAIQEFGVWRTQTYAHASLLQFSVAYLLEGVSIGTVVELLRGLISHLSPKPEDAAPI